MNIKTKYILEKIYVFIFFHFNIKTNNTFSLEQISTTGILDANSILRQHKLDMSRYWLDLWKLDHSTQ